MQQTFPAFLPELFQHEGGYVDHPRDPGGATNFGITHKTLAAWRGRPVSRADVRALTRDEAGRIYRARYWDEIGGDAMPAGPDAALFDVAVNSGVGRARHWKPLAAGKSAVDAVKAISARRRSFLRALSTFDVFGKGWLKRVARVEAWSIAWAIKAQGGDAGAVLRKEAEASKSVAKKSGSGAVGGSIAGQGAVITQGDRFEWSMLLMVGVPSLVLIGFLIYLAVAHSSRAEAMEGAFHV